MHHDDAADETRARAPACSSAVLTLPISIQVLDIEAFGKVGTEVVARTRLQRFAILHQGLDGVGAQRPSEFLILALASHDDRHGRVFFGECPVHLEHHQGTFFRFFDAAVRGMSLLPEEFRSTQKKDRAFLPAHDIVPQVDQDWQIAIALHPPGITMANDGLAGRTNGKRLFKLFAAPACHPGHLWSKSFDMLCLFLEKTTRNEQGKVGIDYPGFLEAVIHEALDIFPDGVAVWPNDHTAPHRCIISQFCFAHHLVIPLRKIVFLVDYLFDILFLVSHNSSIHAFLTDRQTKTSIKKPVLSIRTSLSPVVPPLLSCVVQRNSTYTAMVV